MDHGSSFECYKQVSFPKNKVLTGSVLNILNYHLQGMLRATFTHQNKLLLMEQYYDVMSFMEQLSRSLGCHDFQNLVRQNIMPSSDNCDGFSDFVGLNEASAKICKLVVEGYKSDKDRKLDLISCDIGQTSEFPSFVSVELLSVEKAPDSVSVDGYVDDPIRRSTSFEYLECFLDNKSEKNSDSGRDGETDKSSEQSFGSTSLFQEYFN